MVATRSGSSTGAPELEELLPLEELVLEVEEPEPPDEVELDELELEELVLPDAVPELDEEPEVDVLELEVDELALVELDELELDPEESGNSGSAPANSIWVSIRVSALPMVPEYIWLSSP